MNALRLLRQRRFGAFFTVQALGALNDNVFRNALATLLVFGIGVEAGWDPAGLVNLAALLFILPFFLFSAVFGQLADRFEKSGMIRWIKLFEIVICAYAGLALYLGDVVLLMSVVFLLGFQSTLFGPIKYSILPQLLPPAQLTAGNGLVAAGTYIAILAGTILGPLLAGLELGWPWAVLVGTLIIAGIGWLAALALPPVPIGDPSLKLNLDPVTASWATLRRLGRNRNRLHSVLGVAWFWFYGSIFLVQIPAYTQGVLGGDERALAALLALFIVGISTGALLCDKLSRGAIEIGLVPIGAVGMTVFGLDLMLASPSTPLTEASIAELLARDGSLRIVADLVLIGVSGGLFIVPLYALVQSQSGNDERARVIAGMNIMNALFMVLASALAILLLSVAGLSIPQLFGVVALLNLAVGVYIVLLVPEFALRFLMWVISRLVYRVRVVGTGIQHLPAEGPALITCNHLSFMDPLIIGGTIQRPIRFVMTHRIYHLRGLTWLFRLAGAIPVAPARENPALLQRAFEAVDDALARGELVGIFPEGGLSPDGDVQPFRAGISEILARRPVPVIPMALEGLWGGVFSRAPGRWRRRDRGFFSRVQLKILDPVAPGQADRRELEALTRHHHDQLRSHPT
ncbi:MFS transporter [Wenzhouxiangella sp. XN79A]|uniref:MFS transporter n=1 Tax=Wenzhouxiangella sp. XN79A TaxID=2724193 RepID=UPI00144AA075|nr:MFS transporter [Wenzhouxiangella sp. XN79A]NKI34272.1 MFS transporter [Wenzhouxiangella sp. XN79A]